MRSIFTIGLALVLVNAWATESFEQRVESAKAIERTEQGVAYERVFLEAIGEYMQKAMVECAPKSAKFKMQGFVLVADVLSKGSLNNLDVRPDNEVTKCFAEKMSKAPVPAPPAVVPLNGFPIVVEMNINP